MSIGLDSLGYQKAMTTQEQQFSQDPLLSEIRRILVKDESGIPTTLLDRLATELSHTRKRRRNTHYIQQEDPVLTAIKRVLRDEKVSFHWEKIALLGCSAGGDVALRILFQNIVYPHIPIVLAMHHNPGFQFLAGLELGNGVTQEPLVVESDTSIKSAEIYFLPGDKWIGYHKTDSAFRLDPLPSKPRFRPSIDQVFSTAAQRFGGKLVGVILSGMLDDGAKGLQNIFLNGGDALIQNPSSADFDDMPRAAITAVPTAQKMSLEEIASQINHYSREFLAPRSFKLVFQTTPH
jgi:two-component system chemotaxis response regulator CheB